MASTENKETYDRFPGLVCRTRIPDSLKTIIGVEKLVVIQAYKGFALLECRPCSHVFVVEIHEQAAEVHEQIDWSCPACAEKKFRQAFGHTNKVGGKAHGRAHTRTDRRIGDTPGDTHQWDVAA